MTEKIKPSEVKVGQQFLAHWHKQGSTIYDFTIVKFSDDKSAVRIRNNESQMETWYWTKNFDSTYIVLDFVSEEE